jgi:hypothetical protein
MFVKASLTDFVAEMIGEPSPGPMSSAALGDLQSEFQLTIATFRQFCLSVRLRWPKSEPDYQPTAEEEAMGLLQAQLKETQELEGKIRDMNDAIKQLRQFSSMCPACRMFVASYICPHCHLFLSCVLCKESALDGRCPGCQKEYEEALLINKTCYFGKEFEIQAKREEDERKRAAEAKVKRKPK